MSAASVRRGPLATIGGNVGQNGSANATASAAATNDMRQKLATIFMPINILGAFAGAQLYYGGHIVMTLLSALNCLVALLTIGLTCAMTVYDMALLDKLRCLVLLSCCTKNF